MERAGQCRASYPGQSVPPSLHRRAGAADSHHKPISRVGRSVTVSDLLLGVGL